VAVTTPDPVPGGPDGGTASPRVRDIPLHAWLTLLGPAFLAMAGLGVFVVSGTWLDDAFGVSTGGLGAVAMGIGAVELLGSTGSAGFADRIGKLRSTVAGIGLLLAGLAVMAVAGSSLVLGVVALLLFLLGFEFGFVTSFSLVSEAVPDARGTTLALGNGIGTLARGSGTIASGALYGAHGIGGTVALATAAAILSLASLLGGRALRSRTD
jgi:predicted MFS family arabinose efflux permease